MMRLAASLFSYKNSHSKKYDIPTPKWYPDFVHMMMLAASLFSYKNSPSKKYDIPIPLWFSDFVSTMLAASYDEAGSITFFIQKLISNQLYVWIPAQKPYFVLMLLRASYFITIILYYLLTKCNPSVALCTPFNPSPCSHYCTLLSTLPCICCFPLSLIW